MPYKSAFMSHAHADNAKCDPYAEALIQRGVSLYYDRANPQVGNDLSEALEQQLKKATVLILMATTASLKSFWVKQEIGTFFEFMAEDPSRKIITVKLESCNLPKRISHYWWIDATKESFTHVVSNLVKALQEADPTVTSPTIPPTRLHSRPAAAPAPRSNMPMPDFVLPTVRPTPESPIAVPVSPLPWATPPLTEHSAMPVVPASREQFPRRLTSVQNSPAESQPAIVSLEREGVSRRKFLAAGIAGAAGIAMIGTGVIWWSRTASSKDSNSAPTLPLTFRGHSGYVISVAWSPKEMRIASVSTDNDMRVWDAPSGRLVYDIGAGAPAEWSPDGMYIASSAYGDILVFDSSNGNNSLSYKNAGYGGAIAISWSPKGTRMAAGTDRDGRTVQIWNTGAESPVFIYRGHSDAVNAVSWSPDGMRIASGSDDTTVQVWNATNGRDPYIYRGHSARVASVVWSPSGTRIASASYDQTVHVWDSVNGSHVFTFRGHSTLINSVAWSPDGNRIASTDNNSVYVWNADNGGHLYTYHGHTDVIFSVAWSHDGNLIASGSADKTVQVWRPQ